MGRDLSRLGFTLGDYPRPAGGDAALFDSVAEQALAAERPAHTSIFLRLRC